MFTPWRMDVGPASARLLARHGWVAPPAEECPSGLELAERLLQPLLQNHPALQDCDVYVAGPQSLTNAVEFMLLERGLPHAQLSVSTLES